MCSSFKRFLCCMIYSQLMALCSTSRPFCCFLKNWKKKLRCPQLLQINNLSDSYVSTHFPKKNNLCQNCDISLFDTSSFPNTLRWVEKKERAFFFSPFCRELPSPPPDAISVIGKGPDSELRFVCCVVWSALPIFSFTACLGVHPGKPVM